MIDLFKIKLNGQYDEIGATPTINEGLFLCDTTSENYTRGYTYQVTTSSTHTDVARVDAVSDYKIQQAIYPTIQNVCEWLNNWFTLKYNYRNNFAWGEFGYSGTYHEIPQAPQTGDLCKIRVTDNWDLVSLYSNYFVSYVTVTENGITGDSPLFKDNVYYYYFIMRLPLDVEQAICNMIYYDVCSRGDITDLKSENIGNYSYTKEDVNIGSLSYPSELIGGLEACYRLVRFVQ